MKNFVRAALAAALMAVAWALFAQPKDILAEEGAAMPGVAVVELFTSEGCSSCPPADALLSDIVTEAKASGRPVYALSFHVDYWDRLGWKDPFGDAAYTARQRAYAEVFQNGSLYTPQLVVNGTNEFVGSDRRKAKDAIEAALNVPARAAMAITATKSGDGAIRTEISAPEAPIGALVAVALVEDGLQSQVTRGENAYHTLRHSHVVRAFASAPLGEGGEGGVTLEAPSGVEFDHCRVIAFLQDSKTLAVLGATDASVRP